MVTEYRFTGSTPGPWKLKHVQGNNFAVQRFEFRSAHSYPIFQKDCSAIDGSTVCCSPEDAVLIAAAPDMAARILELEAALRWIDENVVSDGCCINDHINKRCKKALKGSAPETKGDAGADPV